MSRRPPSIPSQVDGDVGARLESRRRMLKYLSRSAWEAGHRFSGRATIRTRSDWIGLADCSSCGHTRDHSGSTFRWRNIHTDDHDAALLAVKNPPPPQEAGPL